MKISYLMHVKICLIVNKEKLTRGVILQVNVKFRRAWFILYKFILNKQNLLIMLFPFSLWSEFHFPPVDHGIPCFSMTWISFFSCRSCSFRFSHDSMIQFSLRVSLSGIEKKKYYIAPHLTKSARECPACRDILKLIFWI